MYGSVEVTLTLVASLKTGRSGIESSESESGLEFFFAGMVEGNQKKTSGVKGLPKWLLGLVIAGE